MTPTGELISAFHQTLPATGSQLLRSSSSDVALSIAKRLGEQLIVGDRRYLMRAMICGQRDDLGNRYFYL